MSLFANLAPGDIWTLSGISFASAINDILDKEDFTLEELLEEDELIQEVKSKNDRLIDFLCLESTLDQLIDFVILGTSDVENELRVYKYPYMSCEVICCEIPEILSNFVEMHDGRYLKKLFTVLSSTEKLDNYLSGYFEKILEMLFRRMTLPMMKFLNEAGSNLLVDFLNHMDNYSIMQIVQRLMLPHIPFNNQADKEMPMDDALENSQCNWSYSSESCALLLSKLFDETNADVPLHISDLLITVLQLSPPQTLVIKKLCDPDCIDKLLTYSVAEGADSNNVSLPISPLASMSLASISVLESLISRLFESSLPFEQNQNIDRETENEHFAFVKICIDSICEQFVRFVPAINQILRSYLSTVETPCDSLCNQSKVIVPRLGHRGLQLVKLIESVVRLSSGDIDKAMCSSGLFRTCIELMYFFKSNSLLHLSVQRLLITVIESDRSRSETQLYLLTNCSMIEAVMTTISCYNVKSGNNNVNTSADDQAQQAQQQQLTAELQESEYYATKHSSIMGNAVLMAQAIATVLSLDMASNSMDPLSASYSREYPHEDSGFVDESGGKQPAASAVRSEGATDDEGMFFARNEASTNPDMMIGHDGSHHLTRPFHSLSMDQIGFNAATGAGQSPFSLRSLMNDESLLARWDLFVDDKLRPILEDQIGGNSFPMQNSTNASFNINQDPDGMKDNMNEYYDDEDDEDEDDDDFVSNHAVSNNGGRIEELESDNDVWGDNYFANDVSPDDDFYVAPDTSSPDGARPPENAFDFTGFADFDAFGVESAFNQTTNLADVNYTSEPQLQQPSSQADLSFDAFADFPDSPSDDDVFGNTHSSNKSGELVNAEDIFGSSDGGQQPDDHSSNVVDDPFA